MTIIRRMIMITAKVAFLLQHLSIAPATPPLPSSSRPGVGLTSLKTAAVSSCSLVNGAPL